VRNVREPRLAAASQQALGALERALLTLESHHDPEVLQAGARRLALTLARALQLTLLCEHAQWLLDEERDERGLAAALRFARQPVDLMHDVDPALDRVLLGP
jgi:acyl-CoA dehydrogenase